MFTDLTLPLYSYVSLMFNLIVSSIMADGLLECVLILNQCNCIHTHLYHPRHFFTIRSLIQKFSSGISFKLRHHNDIHFGTKYQLKFQFLVLYCILYEIGLVYSFYFYMHYRLYDRVLLYILSNSFLQKSRLALVR